MITIKYTDKSGGEAITKIDVKVNQADLPLLNDALQYAALDEANFSSRVNDYLTEHSKENKLIHG